MEHEGLIGIAVQTAIFLLGGFGMVIKNDLSNKTLRGEVKLIQLELRKLADVITTQAVQTTRIDNLNTQVSSLERRVEDLRRGQGYVQARGRLAIDGEYP